MYTILSIIALCAEAALIGLFVFQSIKTKKIVSKNTPWYAIPVCCLIYYIYIVGYVYTGNQLTAFVMLKMISITLEALVFKVDLSILTELALDNSWYYAAASIAGMLAGATLVASIIGLFGAKIANIRRVNRAIRAGRECVLGDSETALSYAKNNGAVILTFGGKSAVKKLVEKGYPTLSADKSLSRKFGVGKRGIIKNAGSEGKMFHFIAFADGGMPYAQMIDWFIIQFDNIDKMYFTLHLEASLEEMDVINRKFIDVKKSKNICVKSFNKYELMSREFIMNYPMSLYLPQDFYGELRTVKSDKKINVVCIGFGKVNYELMKILIMQNQFVGISKDKKKFINHPVDYYVYDNSEDKIYCDMLQKLQTGYGRIKRSDLPAPENICNIADIENVNVYSVRFAEKLDSIFEDENSYSFVLVSMGSDFENMAYAEHLNAAYGAGNNIKVFTRIKENPTLKSKSDAISCYGYDNDILIRDVLINDSLDNIARKINVQYAKISEGLEKGIESFNTLNTIERYSNIYHAASIFFKMGLLGLKFVDKNDDSKALALDKEELFNRYNGYNAKADYDRYFEMNVWCMLGFSEHSRWVAQYLLKGFRPMLFNEITLGKNKDGKTEAICKNIDARKHCCITDYYGLDKYHKYLVKFYDNSGIGKPIEDVETYKYDYMVVNDCYDMMIESGYKLVEI